jgi:N-acyl-D-aspartate/D-glutamate deacylase
MRVRTALFGASLVLASSLGGPVSAEDVSFDIVIRGGTVYDGSGNPGRRADVGIRGDRIAAVGNLSGAAAKSVVDASGLAVAPGFVNMLSWSVDTLIADGRSQSEIRQGVTTEIFGEGWTMGPWNDEQKKRAREDQTDIRFDIEWTTLSEYLRWLEKRGISPNVASYVGASTVRENVLGLENRAPTPAQLEQMQALVRREMENGALGVGTALIYPPGTFATTEELIALCRVAAEYQGKYITHMRSEGDRLAEAVDEVIRISREAGVPAEIYHLKAAGVDNWPKMDAVIAKIEAARRDGVKITANMYTYTAGGTALDFCIPPWAHEGGTEKLLERLRDPATRARIAGEIREPGKGWENLYRASGSPENILVDEFNDEKLKPLAGKTLAEIARLRKKDPVETLLDLVVEDQAKTGALYFLISEDNIEKQLRLPWVSFGSDAGSMAPEGVFLKSSTHPRAYGTFARFLGKYVREKKVASLPEAIRRLSALPASNLGLDHRGRLEEGMFADVVVFDPATIADRATYEKPHQYSVGVRHVFVNGIQVLKDGEHTGAKPGRALKGPGAKEKSAASPKT